MEHRRGRDPSTRELAQTASGRRRPRIEGGGEIGEEEGPNKGGSVEDSPHAALQHQSMGNASTRSSIALGIRRISKDMPQDTFKIAQTVTFVLTGWLLIISCVYWQYKILEPYFRALLWAVIVSTALRKFWPAMNLIVEASEHVVPVLGVVSPADAWGQFVAGFMWRPFSRFLNGDRHSRVFIGMLGRAWILRLLCLRWQHWMAVLIVVFCAGALLGSWAFSLWAYRRARIALRMPVEERPEGGCFTFAATFKLALGILLLALLVASVLQVYYEVLLMYRQVTSLLPSGTWSAEAIERLKALGLQQLQGDGNSTEADLDICSIVQSHLDMDENLQGLCIMAKGWLTSYLVNSTAAETCAGSANLTSVNATWGNSTCGENGNREEMNGSPFELLARTIEESFQMLLFKYAPRTFKLYDGVYTYLEGFSAKFGLAGTRTRVASRYPEFNALENPGLSDLWGALMEAAGELKDVAANMSSSGISGIAQSAQEVGKFTMTTSWTVTWQMLYGLMSIILFCFDAVFQLIVFSSATFYLYIAEIGILEHFKLIAENFDQGHGERLYNGLDESLGAVLGAPLKSALFHALFTCLLLVCFGSSFVCIPSGVVAVVSVVFPSLAGLGTLVFGGILFCSGLYWSAGAVIALSLFVWWYVPTAIYEDIQNTHSFLTGLVVVMGASCMGPLGIIIGPFLLVVPYHLINSMTSQPSFSPKVMRQDSRLPSFSQ